MSRPYDASYRCGRQLAAAGCALDYLDYLPGAREEHCRGLYVREMGGYAGNCAIDFAASTGYVIGIIVGTDLPGGVIVSEWDVSPPWDQFVDWACDPLDVIPKAHQHIYEQFFNSRLSEVLNERHRLVRGRPVAGLLCGRAFEAIPESVTASGFAYANVSISDDAGRRSTLRVALTIGRSITRALKGTIVRREGRLFDKRDSVPGGSRRR